MGKAKKRFIDPANSQHFHVVHRSQRDVKCDDVQAPQYVLLPSRRGNAAARAPADQALLGEGNEDGAPAGKGQWRDHVNELGLPNDGYDYSRHLKTIGGGRFIAASGEVAPGRVYELSEDPELWGKEGKGGEGGEGTIKPVVDAITLSADCMDEDMEAALFGSEDEGEEGEDGEGGGFEELNDDFILQAGQEPVAEEGGEEEGGGAFDFEAHMARLIAKSEKSLGWAPARGWEDGELERLERLVPNKGLEGYDSEDEEDVGVSTQRIRARRLAKVGGGGGVGVADKDRAWVDEDFEDLLGEYSEDEIGELEDPAEEDAVTRGVVEVDGTGVGGDAYIEEILDDFLRSKIADSESDESGAESGEEEEELATPSRGGRGLFGRRKVEVEEEEEGEEEEEVLDGAVASGQAGGQDEMEAFIVKHEYLGDREPETPWDCETILSTCSNLDNHPIVIKEDGGGKRKNKKKKAWMMPAVPEGGEAVAGPEGAVAMVALSKKSGLPLGVLPITEKKEGNAAAGGGQNAGSKRDKGETEEEKRARKAAVKQARRETRQKKKELAQAFKEVDRVAGVQSRNSETAVARSVFQYS